jgi:hypothetical protein
LDREKPLFPCKAAFFVGKIGSSKKSHRANNIITKQLLFNRLEIVNQVHVLASLAEGFV